MSKSKHIAITGAGLVGSLLSIYLAKRGYQVTVFERRGDMRKSGYEGGPLH
ncbi:MAG: FAD-dependent oxidoreductase [Cytophagales bacterium]|nr:FAD-dependent oxidoreductase [Cytophagales bacterium]